MRVLEARFHPQNGKADFIVIAHVIWDGDIDREVPKLEPMASLREQEARSMMLAKLGFLIANSMPEAFKRLQALKSRFWSFVEVDLKEAA
jgi:hypothetical protein